MKNDNVKSFLILFVICIVVAALLGTVNYFTEPVIEKNDQEKVIRTLLVVMPDGEDFEEIEFDGLPSVITQVYKEKNGGYVFTLKTSGYATNFIIMCGIDASGKVTGAECISSGETLGKEKTYGETLKGSDIDSINGVDTVSGATLTTRAYKNAVSDALKAFEILSREAAGNE